ncbi:HD domain-containing protein [Nocardia sp. alder85J]|uniref:HD domain-containing protein n=1 Tax=Nocardia sp. alder85J TaxID=2862949 RepID=UPI001CD5E4DF|nr:HD domain-containing protein [Nocardia sp. alder85J]MCX4093671.1 HD domain-containing protein [Nocardia sp. alder85J]
MGTELVDWASSVAREQLIGLPRRWRHVQGVAARAMSAVGVVDDGAVLVAAAWLHDVGYSPDLVRTGFHPVDGADYCAKLGMPERVSALVAHHSCACVEARRRGLVVDWPDERTALRDALWWADMTTTPDGMETTLGARLAEVFARYGDGDVVSQSLREAKDELQAAVGRTEVRLHDQVK